MDQCMNCTVRGDIDACLKTPCSQHDSWYAQTLKAQQRPSRSDITWVGLTDEEIEDLLSMFFTGDEQIKAIEAKLKEKNQ